MLDLKKDNVGSKIIRFPQKKDFQRKDFKRQSSIITVVKHRQKVYNNYRESDIFSNGGTVIMDELQKDVAVIGNDIGYLKKDVDELKSDVKSISTEKLPAIQTDIAVIKDKVANISDRLGDISSWFKGLTVTIIGGIIVGLILYYINAGS